MSSPAFGMDTVLLGGFAGAVLNTGPSYSIVSGPQNWNATAVNRISVMPITGTIKNLYVNVTAAPGVGNGYTFWIMEGSGTGLSSTTITCTIQDTATSCNDIVDSTVSAQGRFFNIGAGIIAGAPAALTTNVSVTISAGANQSFIFGSKGNANMTLGTSFYALEETNTSDPVYTTKESVIPTGGVISNMTVALLVAPTAGKSLDFGMMVNGSTPSIHCQVAGTNKTCTDSVNTVSVNAGDTAVFFSSSTGTPSLSVLRYSFEWAPTIDGESIQLAGLSGTAPSASAIQYIYPTGGVGGQWLSTEPNRATPAQTMTAKNLYVKLNGPPGGATSYTFHLRQNSGATSPDLNCQISGANTTCNDTADAPTLTGGDKIDVQSVPSGTPTAATVGWGFVSYIAPPGGTSAPQRTLTGVGL